MHESSGNYVVGNPHTKTNRRIILRAAYQASDFDFALTYIEQLDIFYVFPMDVLIGYGSAIHPVETEKCQRQPRSAHYREAWELLLPLQFGAAGFLIYC